MTKRIALAAWAALLSFPAAAAAAPSGGVVLTANTHTHAIQVIDRRHVVHAYHVRGSLAAVAQGSRVRFGASGTAARHLTVARRRARQVSFLGRVVRLTSRTLILRLGDHRLDRVSSATSHLASIKDRRLAPGQVVLVTIRFGSARGGRGHGPSQVSVAPVSSTNETGTPETSGQVVEVDPGALVVQSMSGASQRFAVAPSVITGLQLSLCDTVAVDYHQSGAALMADTVKNVDLPNTGAICNSDGSGGGGNLPTTGTDALGTVTQLTLAGLTIRTPQGAPETFRATLDLTDGFVLGDPVDVTYDQLGAGPPTAIDVEYQNSDAIGTVTYVDSGSVTMIDSVKGTPETFTDDPQNGSFDGISAGDQIDVSYHVSATGQTVVDSVSDMTNPS